MNAKKILFPTDYSHLSDAALEYATTLARESGATLLILHVEEPPIAYGGGEMYYGIPDPDRDEVQRMLRNIRPHHPDVPFEHRSVMGDPAAEIVKVADEENVDLIVMGSHGRTGLSRVVMGSVAEAVVRRANCPVLTYKAHAHTAQKA